MTQFYINFSILEHQIDVFICIVQNLRFSGFSLYPLSFFLYSPFKVIERTSYLQGLFSAIFHICPSNISLQFDTTMMNMMMILVFIKIFQLRHADTAYNAFHVMYVFAVVLVFEAVSLYVFNTAWRLAFCIIQKTNCHF